MDDVCEICNVKRVENKTISDELESIEIPHHLMMITLVA